MSRLKGIMGVNTEIASSGSIAKLKITFVLFAFGAAASIAVLEALSGSWWKFIPPVLILAGYWLVGARSEYTITHSDVFGDSMYFMGFLMTLVSLTASMIHIGISLDESAADTMVLLGSFGTALSTTILGLFARIYCTSFQATNTDASMAVHTTVTDEVNKLRTELISMIADISQVRTHINDLVKTPVDALETHFARSGKSIHQLTETLSKEISASSQDTLGQFKVSSRELLKEVRKSSQEALKAIKTASNSSTKSMEQTHIHAVKRAQKALDELNTRIEQSKGPDEVFKDLYKGSFDALTDQAMELEGNFVKLNKKTEEAGAQLQSLTTSVGPITEMASMLVDLNMTVDKISSSTQTFAKALESASTAVSSIEKSAHSIHSTHAAVSGAFQAELSAAQQSCEQIKKQLDFVKNYREQAANAAIEIVSSLQRNFDEATARLNQGK